MNGNQVVSTMFDIKTSIHTDIIVLFGDWNEDPEWLGIYLNMYLSSGCNRGLFEFMKWIHIVCLVAMSSIGFEWHGSTLYVL